MENDLKRQVDEAVDKGKAETEEMRADVEARAEEAKADIDARISEARDDVQEHMDEVRGEATRELNKARDAASDVGRSVEHNRDEVEDRLVQALHQTGEQQATNANKGVIDRIKGIFTGGHN